MTTNKEIKPCPFCGALSAPTAMTELQITGISKEDSESDQIYAVCCNAYNGGCGATSGYESTNHEAINAWNRRANEQTREG